MVGGWQLSGELEGTWLSEMHSLDPNDPAAEWIRHPQPFQRRALTAAAFDGKLYVIGGMDADHKISRSVEIRDTQTQPWSTGPELPGEGMNGFGVSAWTLNDVLFASGSNGTVYRLEAGDLHWHEHLKLAQPRFFHRLLPASPCLLFAAGGACAAVDAVMQGVARNAFVAARPPGHHATGEHSMGFCIFNNFAVAARYAQNNYKDIAPVASIDWHVHHCHVKQ